MDIYECCVDPGYRSNIIYTCYNLYELFISPRGINEEMPKEAKLKNGSERSVFHILKKRLNDRYPGKFSIPEKSSKKNKIFFKKVLTK